MHRTPLRALVALAAFAAAACGSSSDGNAKMNVRLVDAPGDAYQEIKLDVQRVEISVAGAGWVRLDDPAAPHPVIDLLQLRNGVSATLAEGATIPAGTYGQLRLVLGPANTVKTQDGVVHDLTVPSGQQSGVKLNVHFDVQPGTTKDVFIDFDAHRSIFVHSAGNSDKYILRPVVRAFDKLVTGSIQGVLTDAQTHLGLPGATVMAEVIGAADEPVVVRSVQTAADGSYTLDLLPVDAAYHVVAQPVVGAASYAAQASASIALPTSAPVQAWSAAFALAPATGTLAGSITPAATADEADLVDVTQPLLAGATPTLLVVRTAVPASIASVESWSAPLLPTGTYGVTAVRRTIDASGAETVRRVAAANVAVASGPTATVDLVFP